MHRLRHQNTQFPRVGLCRCFAELWGLVNIICSLMSDYYQFQAGRKSNRLFYLSIPPNIFVDVVRCASLRASSANGWTRVIVEKPFGRDSESSGELTKSLKQYLREDQIFRFVLLAQILEWKLKLKEIVLLLY